MHIPHTHARCESVRDPAVLDLRTTAMRFNLPFEVAAQSSPPPRRFRAESCKTCPDRDACDLARAYARPTVEPAGKPLYH